MGINSLLDLMENFKIEATQMQNLADEYDSIRNLNLNTLSGAMNQSVANFYSKYDGNKISDGEGKDNIPIVVGDLKNTTDYIQNHLNIFGKIANNTHTGAVYGRTLSTESQI